MRSDSAQEFRPGELVQTMTDDHVTGVPLGTVGRIQRKLRTGDTYRVSFEGYGFYEIEASDLCGVRRKAANLAGG